MSLPALKKEKAGRLSRKPARLPILNAGLWPTLHIRSSVGEPINHIFNYVHPRTRNSDDASDAIPTRVTVYLTSDGHLEAEPQCSDAHPPCEMPNIHNLERVHVTEQQLYMLTLMTDFVWRQNQEEFWSKNFNANDSSMNDSRIKFLEAFRDGHLEEAWRIGHESARIILGADNAAMEDILDQGFWEMNELLNEPQRPANDQLSEPHFGLFYVLRAGNISAAGQMNRPQLHIMTNSVQRATNEYNGSGREVRPEAKNSTSESPTSPSPQARLLPEASTAKQQHPDESFESLNVKPNLEDITFLARFPIAEEAAKTQSPVLRANSRVHPRPYPGKQNDRKKNSKKGKKIKSGSQQISTEATTRDATEMPCEDPASNVDDPALNESLAKAATDGAYQASKCGNTKLHLQPIIGSRNSEFGATAMPPTEEYQTGAQPGTPLVYSTTETSPASSERRESVRSTSSNQTIPTPEESPDTGSPATGPQDSSDEVSAAAEKLAYESLRTKMVPHVLHGTDLAMSLNVSAKDGALDENGAEPARDSGSSCVVEKEGGVVFVYYTWRGLTQAKRGVRQLADIFGVGWVEKGIVVYSIDEAWHLVGAA